MRGRRRAAGVLSLLLFLLLCLPLAFIVLGVIAGADELAGVLMRTSSTKSALESLAAGTGTTDWPSFPKNLPAAVELLQRYGATSLNVVTRFAGAAAAGFVALFIYFAGAYVFLVDGPHIWEWIKRYSPLDSSYVDRLGAAFHETGRGLLVGVGLTSATQGFVATIAYLSLGVPRWWVLGPITGFASLIPLVGSVLIWLPIAVALFLTGHTIKGTILLIIGAGVISMVDNVLRPVYARIGSLQMPTFLLLVSIFGGIAAFGTWGAVLGPLIVRLWMETLILRREGVA